MFKVLIAGGRHYANFKRVLEEVESLPQKPDLIIHGGATGADTLAQLVANQLSIVTMVFPADWPRYGKSAGPMRNKLMIDQRPDLLLAFPGGRGTEDIIKKAREAGITYRRIE